METNSRACFPVLSLVVLWLGLTVPLFALESTDQRDEPFLRYWFGSPDYTVSLGPPVSADADHRLRIAVHEVDLKRSVFDRALLYSVGDDGIRLHGIIVGPRIFSGDGRQLIDVESAPGQFYGWTLELTGATDSPRFGIRLVSYADHGERVSGLPGIGWSMRDQQLSRFDIDRSQW